MTLGEYAELKGGSLLDIVHYAQNRGLELPEDENYAFSAHELQVIDPVVAQSQPSPSSQPAENRQLGFVKFFDPYKGFGFIIGNPGSFGEFYVSREHISGHSSLRSDQWVSFEENKDRKGRPIADKVKAVTPDEDDLLLALKFVGPRAYIKGVDKQGDSHNVNVSHKIASDFIRKESAGRFFKVLSGHFSAIEDIGRRNAAIKELVEDGKSRRLILGLKAEICDASVKEILLTALEVEISENGGVLDSTLRLSKELVQNLPAGMAYNYFLATNDFQSAGSLAAENAGDLENPLGLLFAATGDKPNRRALFNEFLRPLTASQISNLTDGCTWADLDELFVQAALDTFKYPVFGNPEGFPGDYYFQSYMLTEGDPAYLSRVSVPEISAWLGHIESEECWTFLNLIAKRADAEAILCQIDSSLIAKAISGGAEESVQLEYVNKLPIEIAKTVVGRHFVDTQLYSNFVKEQWERLKLKIPHLTFDIESDGENISQFAFRYQEALRPYRGDSQIPSLIRRLNSAPVVVGHMIKEWDLPILEQRGYDLHIAGFIWDTLEIELLLNPCRYAYSLRTTHIAQDDVELTDDLFWNQLFRLSKDEALCRELREELPPAINEYIKLLQDPFFADAFRAEAKDGEQFFQELIPLNKELVSRLEELNEISKQENLLVIAPKDIWPRLAQHLSLRFPTESSRDYYSINPKNFIAGNLVIQKILARFCQESMTPLVINLPQYLRAGEGPRMLHISDDMLEAMACQSDGRIDCIDFDSFKLVGKLKRQYSRIVTIGGELHDRIHRVKIGETYDSISPYVMQSRLFLRMASCNYALVPEEDYDHFSITRDDLMASVWSERDLFGQISIYKNLKFRIAKERFLSNFDASLERIAWRLEGQLQEQLSPTIITVKPDNDNIRLSPSTTYRSKYWAYQFGLIKELKSNLPIIYVVNDSQEVEKVSCLARDLGYYVPLHGTGFRKLEHIESHANGLIVISKDQFVNGIGAYRTNQPYCYVWDNMDIDRLRLMWDVLPFEDDELTAGNSESDGVSGKTTPGKCIMAAWPIMKHYYSLIKANSGESKMFIIDPQFDDNPDVADKCHCEMLQFESSDCMEGYAERLRIGESHFREFEFAIPELAAEQAMETIRLNFIPNFSWHDYQREILPRVLERNNDLLISLPTGGGKSILFQGPAIYRAASSHRLSLVISPLRALMQDQVEELNEKGFGGAVDYLSADRTYPEVQEIYRRIRSGELALLYITPERFRVRSFMKALQQRLENDRGLEYVVFDEAHCISQWGQEFRPDYRNAILECTRLKNRYDIKLCLLSATVTSQIENDIRGFVPDITRLGQSVEDYNPVRQHIGISFKVTDHEDQSRVDEIFQYIQHNHIDFAKSRMIIFCRTQRQCEEVSALLSQRLRQDDALSDIADHMGYFHAGMDADRRNDTYRLFKGGEAHQESELYILCATKAFGMGMDIPNIHYVVHFSPPSVMEDYLQEVGRAGRNEAMYQSAFVDGRRIPAQCLVSEEDFRQLKELLIRSLMSWSDLEVVRRKIVEYILQFKSLEEALGAATVVPFNVWTKEESPERFNDTTASRIAFHWLEQLKLVSLGYLDQACMSLTLRSDWNSAKITGNAALIRKIGEALGEYCPKVGAPFLIPIREMRERANSSWPIIMDILLQAQRKSILSINERIRCVIKSRRFSETKYMIENNKNLFALHIVMDGIRTVLSEVGIGKRKVFDAEAIRSIVAHLMDNVGFETNTIKDKSGKEIVYMPWKGEGADSNVRGDVTRAETFKKEIIGRTGPNIFWLINLIPGVHSSSKRTDDGTRQYTITVRNRAWSNYVNEWERDLFEILRYIKDNSGAFSWAEMLLKLDLISPTKGYAYFDNSLSLLKSIQYIDHTPLISSGIEVHLTERGFEAIDEHPDSRSLFFDKRQEFDQEEKLKKIRIAAMDIFSKIGPERQSEYIREYFQCRNYDEFLALVGDFCPEDCSDILSELNEEALLKEEGKLKDNEAQLGIYNASVTKNINVLAGPGSGKTHVLTLRCARLVYREHVNPSNILVLAYNRAVVVELKNRLNKLFRSLGLSRMAHHMHVYTFHALAKVVMGATLDGIDPQRWENMLCEYLRSHLDQFSAIFPAIDHVLIDEFQDITTPRLNTIAMIHKYYPNARFFTIGDVNQSIYGFDRVANFHGSPQDYAKLSGPEPYYERLRELLRPMEMSMFRNYRSYQEILDKAAEFIPEGHQLPTSAPSLMAHAPSHPCVFETDKGSWFSKMPEIISYAQEENSSADPHRHIDTIAVFFRTNNEVYRGFTQLKKQNIDPAIRVRIQGTSSCELWRQREMYHIISLLKQNPTSTIVLSNDSTKKVIKSWIERAIADHPNWDSYMLDVAYTLVLHYLESIRSDERTHTYGELADYLKDIAGRDDGGQVYKIYDEHQPERIFKDRQLTIVLTTMHKVKGLEFDIVVVTPSFANLPMKATPGSFMPEEVIMADIEEERRLRFVAYTRAKKKLYIFNYDREQALTRRKTYFAPQDMRDQLGINEPDPGLDKYNLGYHSNRDYMFNSHDRLVDVKSNAPVQIQRVANPNWVSYEIVDPTSNCHLGQLSSNSQIRRKMEAEGRAVLDGLFVSDIFAWEYQDSVRYDQEHNTNYAERWCYRAKAQGFVYIVQIAGYGQR